MGLFADSETEQAIYNKLNAYVAKNSVVIECLKNDVQALESRLTKLDAEQSEFVRKHLERHLGNTRQAILKDLVNSLPSKVNDALKLYIKGTLTEKFDGLEKELRDSLSSMKEAHSKDLSNLLRRMNCLMRNSARNLIKVQREFVSVFEKSADDLRSARDIAINAEQITGTKVSMIENRLAAIEEFLQLTIPAPPVKASASLGQSDFDDDSLSLPLAVTGCSVQPDE